MSGEPVRESENAGRSWHLRREYAADFTRAEAIIAPIVDANFDLAEALFQPIVLVAHLEPVDEIGYHAGLPERADWRLEADHPSVPPIPSWNVPETRVVVPALDRASVAEFVRRASNQPADPGETIAPVALWVNAVRARLPAPWSEQGDQLPVRYQGGGTQPVPIERDGSGAWVIGPYESVFMPPIHTYGRVQGVVAQLTVDAHWSPWYQEGAAGTEAIERAVAGLEAKGWRRDP